MVNSVSVSSIIYECNVYKSVSLSLWQCLNLPQLHQKPNKEFTFLKNQRCSCGIYLEMQLMVSAV